ncbi:protein 5NUC-like [Musca vetustissima]|uniref:protein 5NUC-like n=1 Tax=Musca vetustissima TaxID=27455 RepID=UPI002AB73F0A|nr:protein 5NUC-like [Musca vetustissima]
MSLGHHEFDSGVPKLLPFLVNTPKLRHIKRLHNSAGFYVKGAKVGVIGDITSDTLDLTMTKEDIFSDENEAIKLDAFPTNQPAEVASEFIILHNNDMHSRFEQTDAKSGKCAEQLAKEDKCYGGFARVAHLVRKYRKEAEEGGMPVVYLNAGDTSAGTIWYFRFKDDIATAFLNKLLPDAASLGNHEFNTGIPGLVPFLEKVDFPIVAANLDLSATPELRKTKHLQNSTVLDVNGVKVGVIGYITPDTFELTMTKENIFTDEIEAINREAENLKAQGINIIIAVGHSGYEKDQEIAAKCPEVDLVIGGHTNTFLYNSEQPDIENIDGPYPTLVNQTSGKQVPVVQAYAYTKYLGKLHVQFDKDGNLIKFDGTPILLNAEIPRETDVLELLEVYRPEVAKLENDVVGHTMVFIDGRAEVCHFRECNLGNLVTDAMVHARVLEDLGGTYWTDAAVAFVQAGGMRDGIEPRSDGTITAKDVSNVLRHNNDLYVSKISGKTLLAALEHSASMVEKKEPTGFLHMSGVHVTYDYNNPVGSRVVTADIRCAACATPIYEPLDEKKFYNVIISRYLLNEGDGYKFFEDNPGQAQHMKSKEVDVLSIYLKGHDFIYPGVEDRITIIQKIAE